MIEVLDARDFAPEGSYWRYLGQILSPEALAQEHSVRKIRMMERLRREILDLVDPKDRDSVAELLERSCEVAVQNVREERPEKILDDLLNSLQVFKERTERNLELN